MQQPDFRTLATALKHLSPGEVQDIRKAFDFAVEAHKHEKRADGSPYVLHPIAVALIVAEWKADRDTVIGALLHDVLEDTPVTKEQLAESFGRHSALLVEGITKFNQADLSPDLPLDRKIETLRKLFDIMRLDVRGILIKLADRLHNVRTLASLPDERRRRFALETLSVYYKIAFHLGLREIRRAFAEFCVPYAFETGTAEKELRDAVCEESRSVASTIERELKLKEGSHAIVSVSLQPRNLLVFHDRLASRGGGAPLLQDAFSISIIVRTEQNCYSLLKTLHTLYRPATGHFRDYIAAPGDTGYQSLHTHVALEDGSVIEARIRTPEMFERGNQGVIAWLFSNHPTSSPISFAWLERTQELDLKTRDSSSAFWEALESDILRETISITIDRRRISLPRGSTALDAAYALYDARAGFVKSIAVNGRIGLLSNRLGEDDDIHVTFDFVSQATHEWLQMVATQHARLHVVDVLKKSNRTEKITLGATLLQKELDHYNKGLLQNLSRAQCQHLAEHFRRESFDQVLAMIGEGVVRPRDVVFYLFPDRHKNILSFHHIDRYPFRLHLRGSLQAGHDTLDQLHSVIQMGNVTVEKTEVRTHPETQSVDISLSGSAQDRLKFADFIDLLERQEWVTSVQTLIPLWEKAFLLGAFFVAFTVVLLDILLFPFYEQMIASLSVLPRFFVQALPLIPILAVNYYLVRLLRHYVVRLRSDRWFLGVALLLNIIGLMLLVLRMVLLQDAQSSLLPLVIIFVLALVYTGYKFFQTEALFASLDERSIRPISERQWKDIRARKITGYAIRLLAVLIWGLQPLYIRYTPVSELSVLLRTFFLGVGVFAISSVFLLLRHLFDRSKMSLATFRLPYGKFFSLLVVGQIAYMTLKNASLVYTSGTNFLLFGNFAPLLGLLVAAIFWRKEIAYLRQPQTMLWIFLLAVVTGIGSSLLMYNNSLASSTGVIGDVLAFIAAGFDVLLVVAQIQYIKQFPRTDAALLNLYLFFFLLCFTAPLVVFGSLLGWPVLHDLTRTTLLLGIGLGVFEGVGQMCNYEAFKRIDGYLAFMMFNLSILVSFVLEAFVIHSIKPTLTLLVSGALIIGVSVVAEIINSRCQKKGL